ncbi:hypothetical protein AWB67_06936 [Caballeronia terrestris]|uniref:Uncharacterized protein n=1 Tax=Caballeronia terrestris TaxID=1226301 RepID=A0A158KWE3_9BURK|nr:hypothetical protein AWB67_06936 [Caballeronia terrestris]
MCSAAGGLDGLVQVRNARSRGSGLRLGLLEHIFGTIWWLVLIGDNPCDRLLEGFVKGVTEIRKSMKGREYDARWFGPYWRAVGLSKR